LRVSKRALVAIAATGISIGVSSALAGPVHATAGVSRAAARPGLSTLILHWNGSAWK
jgi:hypothetical protein